MKKLFIALSIGLAGCNFGGGAVPNLPAPLAATTIDEKTLVVALQTFDTALTAIDKLIAAKVIVPGSPRALQIADAIRSAKKAYQAASAAQRVGNSGDYGIALSNAQLAVARINSLVKGN
jgi:hypothetical protein